MAQLLVGTLLLLLGAVLAVVVPRGIQLLWPDPNNIPAVALTAEQNTAAGGNSYFLKEPNFAGIKEFYARCSSQESSTRNLVSHPYSNDCFDFSRFGGIPEFGGAFVDIANPQSSSIQVTQVVAVVDSRLTEKFVAKYEPPVGGDIGTSLAFNLDKNPALARRVQTNSDLRAVSKGVVSAFFQDRHFEVESGRSAAFYIVPVGVESAIYKWHLLVTFEALDSGGHRATFTERVAPPGGSFRGVPASAHASRVYEDPLT